MDISPEDIQFGLQFQTLTICMASALTLIIYDVLLTFNREIECVWKRKFSLVTVLYVLNRYASVISLLFQIINAIGPQTILSCQTTFIIYDIAEDTAILVTAVFDALRVWAIWGQRRQLLLILVPIVLVIPAMNIYISSATHVDGVIPLPVPIGGCTTASSISDATWSKLYNTISAFSIIVDVGVLIATWIKTISLRRIAREAGVTTTVAGLVMHDGTLYFGSIFTIQVGLLIMDHFNSSTNPINPYLDAFTSIIIAHMILDLREINVTHEDITAASSHIVFQAMGNIGASLTSSNAELNSISQVSFKQYSEDPLTIGLIDDFGTAGRAVEQDIEMEEVNVQNVDSTYHSEV